MARSCAGWLALAGAVVMACMSGCGGYAATVRDMNSAVARGDIEAAIREVNQELEVDSAADAPRKIDSLTTLLLLERAALSQAVEQYATSAADFELADANLEVLSLTDDTGGSIGRFLFSDDSGLYVGAPYEKLMVNSLNILNFLALGNLEAARVEARRFTTAQELIRQQEGEGAEYLAIGSYLSGLAFEASGRADEALRYYAEALQAGPIESLRGPLKRLAQQTSFRAESLAPYLEGGSEGASPAMGNPGVGTIVVVGVIGRVPHREAERLPIGLALTIVADAQARHAVSSEQRSQANMLAARGLLTWLNMPSLKPTPRALQSAEVFVANQGVPTEMVTDIEQSAAQWFDSIRPALVGTALTRAITRLLAGLAVQEGTKAAGSSGGLAALLGLAVQGALLASDTPDTRSWNSLGARYFVARASVQPGKREVEVKFRGAAGTASARRTVDVRGGQLVVLPVWMPQ